MSYLGNTKTFYRPIKCVEMVHMLYIAKKYNSVYIAIKCVELATMLFTVKKIIRILRIVNLVLVHLSHGGLHGYCEAL